MSTETQQSWITHPVDLPMDARIILHNRQTVRSVRTLLEMDRVPEVYRDLVDASGQICRGKRLILNLMIEEKTPNLNVLSSKVSVPLMFLAPSWLLKVVAFF